MRTSGRGADTADEHGGPAPQGRPGQYDAVMNRVEFIVVDGEEPHLEIEVDGVPLKERARRAERGSARAERQERLAGAYGGLTHLDAVLWPSRHFLGSPVLSASGDGDTVLLGCDCGDWGCWPLSAEVRVLTGTVIWRAFRNGHRPSWDLSGLGLFEFDRDQYESALRAAQRPLPRERVRPPGPGLLAPLPSGANPSSPTRAGRLVP